MTGKRSLGFFLILHTLLQFGDGLSTYIILSFGGTELNPIARYFLETFGLIWGLLLLKTIGILAGIVFYIILTKNELPKLKKKIYTIIFFILISLYIAVNINNWYLVLDNGFI